MRDNREIRLQGEILPAMKAQGFFATKTSDRFLAGKPDMRFARIDVSQLDVELKYLQEERPDTKTGIRRLQEIKLKEMNRSGMPAIGLVFLESHDRFYITNFLRDNFTDSMWYVLKGPKKRVIDGLELFRQANNYLDHHYPELRKRMKR